MAWQAEITKITEAILSFRESVCPGSARVSRAGDGVLAIANFLLKIEN